MKFELFKKNDIIDLLLFQYIGATHNPNESNKQLRAANVPIANQEYCNTQYNGIITDRMICAGYEAGGKDSCQVKRFIVKSVQKSILSIFLIKRVTLADHWPVLLTISVRWLVLYHLVLDALSPNILESMLVFQLFVIGLKKNLDYKMLVEIGNFENTFWIYFFEILA